jgi:hypothetical protein
MNNNQLAILTFFTLLGLPVLVSQDSKQIEKNDTRLGNSLGAFAISKSDTASCVDVAQGSGPSPSPEVKDKSVDLFASRDFSAWTNVDGSPVGKGWVFENGILSRPGASGDIITRDSYKDFELTFEWKISEAGNSGVKYRTRGRLGLEFQVLDDEKHPDGKKPNHRVASLYELVAAPDDKPIKPVGEWNTSKIRARGNLIEHWLNGEKVVSIEWGSGDWYKRFEASKYRKNEGFGSWDGPILLQDHKDPVWYRNLRVRRL